MEVGKTGSTVHMHQVLLGQIELDANITRLLHELAVEVCNIEL